MSSLDHGKIGPNRLKDDFVGQNNGKNNGKSTITANILNCTKFSTFPILSQISEIYPQLPKLTFHEEIKPQKVIWNNVSV
jgi:hypothetical protein